jgi:hypothetical protein
VDFDIETHGRASLENAHWLLEERACISAAADVKKAQ